MLNISCNIVSYVIIALMFVVWTVGSPRKLVNILVVIVCYPVGNNVFIESKVLVSIADMLYEGIVITVVPLLIMLVIVDVMSVSNPLEPMTKFSVFLPLGHISDNIPVLLLVNPYID